MALEVHIGHAQNGNISGRNSRGAETEGDDEGSGTYSDAEEHRSWHSNNYDGFRLSNVSDIETGRCADFNRNSCLSLSSSEEEEESSVVDLEAGGGKVEGGKVVEKICRICHLTLMESSSVSESVAVGEVVEVEEECGGIVGGGVPIELGCCCKDDLAAAHKHCAEAWFKIKGNKTCEICGSVARNIVGPNDTELIEQWAEGNTGAVATAASAAPTESRSFVRGHRFLNFLLACMVFAFVISWLFHFNVPA